MWQNWLRSRAFSIGTDKDAEFDQQTSLAPCWRKEVCHRKLMYMKLVSCVGRERCNVLSSKSRRWLGQEASIGQDASIRMQPKWDERSEVGWKMEEVKRHWHCITWLIALNDRQLCSVNCEQSAIGAASWVKEWQVESPVAFFNLFFFFFFRVRFMMSTYPMSILYGYFEMLWSSASGHLEFDSFLSWYFLLTSTPPLQGLAPWASAHVSRSILTFSTWQGGVQRSPFDVRFFFRRVGNDRTSMHCFPSRRVAVGKAKFLKF